MLDDYLNVEYCILDKISQPDPFGGVLYVYQEGARFTGGPVIDSTAETRIAQQEGARTTYTLVVKKPIELERGTLIRRLSDGANYKLTTDTRDMKTPDFSGLACAQATMERVVL